MQSVLPSKNIRGKAFAYLYPILLTSIPDFCKKFSNRISKYFV